MMSMVIQRLEALRTDLVAIDPDHTIDAADKVAEMARELRRTVMVQSRAGEPNLQTHQPERRAAG